jgi:hypothetical protein
MQKTCAKFTSGAGEALRICWAGMQLLWLIVWVCSATSSSSSAIVEDKHINSTAVCKNHLDLSHAAPLSLLPPPSILAGVGSVCTPSRSLSWGTEGGDEGEEPVLRS